MSVLSFSLSLVVSLLAILGTIFSWSYWSTPVSDPGGPRAIKQASRGNWKKRITTLNASWKFACDTESHEITKKAHNNIELSGESAGRQIWYQNKDISASAANKLFANESSGDVAAESKGKSSDSQSFSAASNPNSGDKLLRDILLKQWEGPRPDESSVPATAIEACRKGIQFYQMIQCSDGHWAGDYGGPLFLLPGLIATLFICKSPIENYQRQGMIAYLRNHQQSDGGWGTHIESPSSMFGTVLSYIALRLLGVDKDEDWMSQARVFIKGQGGALFASSWAKFWLATLGLYEWKGINSIPVEMWLLPRWFPLHPGKMWCHCRMVYLPMGYIYGIRFHPDVAKDPLLLSLRSEIYSDADQDYASIDWHKHIHSVCSGDAYSPVNPLMIFLHKILWYYENGDDWCPVKGLFPLTWLRSSALKFVMRYIHEEDLQTNFIDIGPVNKSLNMLCTWIATGRDGQSPLYSRHIPRVSDYLWVAEDGMKMQGYNGSQCWDTSFAIQGIIESGLSEEFPEMTCKVYSYLERTQIKENEVKRIEFFRHVSKGGWPFSTAAHGWPISDCTSEGLKAVLNLNEMKCIKEKYKGNLPINKTRILDAVNVILSLQNLDGGWATYENNRGYRWYEWLNPSEAFGDIMIDYSYVECSSACLTALISFAMSVDDCDKQVISSIIRGGKFLGTIQRKDGSWYGSWGVCFCYGTWFGIEGVTAVLRFMQKNKHAAFNKAKKKMIFRIIAAINFLLKKQNENGGWGESYLSCVDKSYADDGTGVYGLGGSGVVQTSWAILGILSGIDYFAQSQGSENFLSIMARGEAAVKNGIGFLMRQQREDGDWDQENISGVFNRNCGITYTAYRNIFPIWALGRFANYEKMNA